MSTFFNDIKYALRQLLKSPGFTAVAVLSLALGIGAATAVFSLVNAVLLRPLPVSNPQELRLVHWSGDDLRMTSYSGNFSIAGDRWMEADRFNHPSFLAMRDAAADVADVFGYEPLDILFRLDEKNGVARGLMVSDNFFSVLNVQPLVGRLWNPQDSFAAGPLEVVVSYAWWQRHFAGSPDIIGRIVTMRGSQFTVVGVLPKGFSGMHQGRPADLFVPMTAGSPMLYQSISERFHWFVCLMARVHPAVRDEQLKAVLDVAFAREVALARDGGIMTHPEIKVTPGRHGADWDRQSSGRQLLLLLGVVALVLLTACANLAGLSLARSARRTHDLAVRAALGASRSRLFRLPLAENVLVALIGGGLGVLLAVWGRALIPPLVFGTNHNLQYNSTLDLRVLAFGLGVALTTALLAGLIPGWRASRSNPIDGLGSRGVVGVPRLRVSRALVALQIGLALVLLTGAGLAVRTAINLARIDAGFPVERLLLVDVYVRTSQQARQNLAGFHQRLQEELAALPGAESASFIGFPLLQGRYWTGAFQMPGREIPEAKEVCRLTVGDRFFGTMGIPILQGRGFEAGDDEDAPKVVVINESFVRCYLKGEKPIGLTIEMLGANFRIVGVCRDVKYNDLRQPVRPTTYLPFRQMLLSPSLTSHLNSGTYAVRTALSAEASIASVRRLIARIDPEVVTTGMTTQEEVRDRGFARERLAAGMSGALAGLAVLLSCVGLYGLMAYNVARRTGEIGIRMALGATRQEVARPILREALMLGGIGVAVGVPLALSLSRFIQSQLYGVKPNDPVSLGTAVLALLLVAVAAAWIPAHRAARIDPMEALRYE